MAVTKYKDNEQSSSCIYSTMEPFDPVMSFASFVEDNDNIENEVRLSVTFNDKHILNKLYHSQWYRFIRMRSVLVLLL